MAMVMIPMEAYRCTSEIALFNNGDETYGYIKPDFTAGPLLVSGSKVIMKTDKTYN